MPLPIQFVVGNHHDKGWAASCREAAPNSKYYFDKTFLFPTRASKDAPKRTYIIRHSGVYELNSCTPQGEDRRYYLVDSEGEALPLSFNDARRMVAKLALELATPPDEPVAVVPSAKVEGEVTDASIAVALRREVEDLLRQRQQQAKFLADEQHRAAKLKQSNRDLAENRETLKADVRALRHEWAYYDTLREVEARVAQLEEKREKLNGQVHLLKTDRDMLKTEVTRLQAEITRLEAETAARRPQPGKPGFTEDGRPIIKRFTNLEID